MFPFLKNMSHKNPATKQQDTWDPMANTDWKSKHYPQLPDTTQPKTQLLQCPREPSCPLTPILLLVVCCLLQARFLHNPKDKAWPKCGRQLLLEPHCHPSQQMVTYHHRQHFWGSPGQPLGNEVCLWGNLMDPVVCWVGRCFIIADGHLVSAKLQENKRLCQCH
jgi:hypothetical protein